MNQVDTQRDLPPDIFIAYEKAPKIGFLESKAFLVL